MEHVERSRVPMEHVKPHSWSKVSSTYLIPRCRWWDMCIIVGTFVWFAYSHQLFHLFNLPHSKCSLASSYCGWRLVLSVQRDFSFSISGWKLLLSVIVFRQKKVIVKHHLATCSWHISEVKSSFWNISNHLNNFPRLKNLFPNYVEYISLHL